MELLKGDVHQWKVKKQWYDSINEIHDKKAQLENMISWAQVEDYEKKAAAALKLQEDQAAQIEKVQITHYFCNSSYNSYFNLKICTQG